MPTITQVQLGSYVFAVNPASLSKPRELLQSVGRSINGRGNGSYIPRDDDETKIKVKRSFNLSGEDQGEGVIEAIEQEIEKAPPLFFRNAENETFEVTVESFETSQEATNGENRSWSLSLREA